MGVRLDLEPSAASAAECGASREGGRGPCHHQSKSSYTVLLQSRCCNHLEEQSHQPWPAWVILLVLDKSCDHAAVAGSSGHHIHCHHTTKDRKLIPASSENRGSPPKTKQGLFHCPLDSALHSGNKMLDATHTRKLSRQHLA